MLCQHNIKPVGYLLRKISSILQQVRHSLGLRIMGVYGIPRECSVRSTMDRQVIWLTGKSGQGRAQKQHRTPRTQIYRSYNLGVTEAEPPKQHKQTFTSSLTDRMKHLSLNSLVMFSTWPCKYVQTTLIRVLTMLLVGNHQF